MREDLRNFLQQEGPPEDCIHGIPENISCPECIDAQWRANYIRLENELEAMQDDLDFLKRLLEALCGPGWEKLTIIEAQKIRALSAPCPPTIIPAHNEPGLLQKLVEAAGVEPVTKE